MTGRAWLRHPAKTIHPPACPAGTRYTSQALALAALTHGYGNPQLAATACTHGCGGWHHTRTTT